MINFIEKYRIKYTLFSFLILQILVHSVYGFTFKTGIQEDFEIVKQLNEGVLTTKNYSADSPFYHIGAFLLNIDNFENYLIFISFLSFFVQFLIIYKISFLKNNSLLFISTGWVVTSAWYVGNTDILVVLLTLYLYDAVNKDSFEWFKILLLTSLLTFSHYGLAFFVILSIGILLIDNRKKFLVPIFIFGYLLGRSIIQLYLNYFNFSGRSRLRFLFNDNVLNDTFNLTSTFFLKIIISGFLGIILVLFFVIYKNSVKDNFKIYISLASSIIATSISLDSSRVFSIIIIPLIYYLIYQYTNNENYNNTNLISSLPFLILIVSIIIGEQHVYGVIHFESPNNIEPSLYNIFSTKINSLMKNIWP